MATLNITTSDLGYLLELEGLDNGLDGKLMRKFQFWK